MQAGGVDPLALAHITGGGLFENVPRILPGHLAATFDLGSWDVPEHFRTLVGWGDLPDHEAFRVWTMGIGMVVVVASDQRAAVEAAGLPIIGRLVAAGGDARVSLAGAWR